MSAIFNGTSQHLYVDYVPFTAYPFTFFAWFKFDAADATARHMMALADKDTYDEFFCLSARLDTQEQMFYASTTGDAWNKADRYSYGSSGVWYPLVGVGTNTQSRRIYTTTGYTNDTTSNVTFAAGLDRFFVGGLMNSYQQRFKGRIAHVAVWNIALSQSEAEGLIGGDNPLAVQNSSLKMYYPLYNDANDDKGSNHLTNVGTTTFSTSDNPTVDAPPSAGPDVTSVPDLYANNVATVTGTGFGASRGSGQVYICPTDDVDDANRVAQTILSWTDTSIVITAVRGNLNYNTNLYLFVVEDGGMSNPSGYVVQIKSGITLTWTA